MPIIDAIKKLIGRNSLVGDDAEYNPLYGFGVEGLDYDDLIARLQVAKLEVDRIRQHLINEIREHYESLQEAVKSRDKEAMAASAAEIVLKKRVLRSVIAYGKLIETAIQRINDARNIEAIIKAITPLDYVLATMNDYLSTISPESVAKLNSIISQAEMMVRSTSSLASSLPVARQEPLDPEVQKLIENAMKQAHVESESVAPSIPAEIRVRQKKQQVPLEKRLLQYVKNNRGIVNVRKAARDLGVSEDEIRAALLKLASKGVIKLASKNAESTTPA